MPSAVPATLASTSRRRFLKTAAATTVIGASGTASAQETPTFKLDGRIPGWLGQSPDAIAGRTNPTLSLETGTTYRIRWTNVDGRAHNVALLDGNGTVLKRTKIISEQGATQMLTFTATQEMAEYICEVHPTSMRGEIQIAGEQSSSTQTDTPSDSVSANRFMPKVRLFASKPSLMAVSLRRSILKSHQTMTVDSSLTKSDRSMLSDRTDYRINRLSTSAISS